MNSKLPAASDTFDTRGGGDATSSSRTMKESKVSSPKPLHGRETDGQMQLPGSGFITISSGKDEQEVPVRPAWLHQLGTSWNPTAPDALPFFLISKLPLPPTGPWTSAA